MTNPGNPEDQSPVWHPGTSFRGWRFNAPPPDGALSILDLIDTSRDDHYAPEDIFEAPSKGWSAHVCDGLFTHARCHDVLMFEGANLIGMTGAELMRHMPDGWSDPVIEVDGLARIDCDPLGFVAWLDSGKSDTGRVESCSVCAVWPPAWDPTRSFGGVRFHQPLPKLPSVVWYEIRPFYSDDDPERRVTSVSMWGQDYEKLSTDEALDRIVESHRT